MGRRPTVRHDRDASHHRTDRILVRPPMLATAAFGTAAAAGADAGAIAAAIGFAVAAPSAVAGSRCAAVCPWK